MLAPSIEYSDTLYPATPWMPAAVGFIAGAMIYVVIEEVIPEAQRDRFTDDSVLGFVGGFVVMLVLDVALG